MKKLLIFSVIISGLSLASCGSDEGPEITISSPADGDSFATTDSLSLSGTATDDVGVTSLSLTVSKDGVDQLTGTFNLAGTADPTNIPFSDLIPADINGTGTGEYELTVSAADIDGNSASESVKYNAQ